MIRLTKLEVKFLERFRESPTVPSSGLDQVRLTLARRLSQFGVLKEQDGNFLPAVEIEPLLQLGGFGSKVSDDPLSEKEKAEILDRERAKRVAKNSFIYPPSETDCQQETT